MKSSVLDASVALRWFLDDPMPIYAKRVKQLLIRGARAVVPVLWHLGMSNGLAMAERRQCPSRSSIGHRDPRITCRKLVGHRELEG